MSHYEVQKRETRGGFFNMKKKDKETITLVGIKLKKDKEESKNKNVLTSESKPVLENTVQTEQLALPEVNLDETKQHEDEVENHGVLLSEGTSDSDPVLEQQEDEVENHGVLSSEGTSDSDPVLEEPVKTEEFELLQVEGVYLDEIEEQEIKETAKELEELETITEEEFKNRQEKKLLMYKERVSNFDGDKDLVFFQLEEDLRKDVIEIKKWKRVFPELQKEYSDEFRELRNEVRSKTELNFANEEEQKKYVLRRLDKLDGELKKIEEGMKNQEPTPENKIYWDKTLNMFLEDLEKLEIVEGTFERKREIIIGIKKLYNQLTSLND